MKRALLDAGEEGHGRIYTRHRIDSAALTIVRHLFELDDFGLILVEVDI